MKFIRGIWILFLKELKDLFLSPLVYIVTALFCLIMGWLFFNYLILSKNLTTVTLTESILVPIFGNMNFVFLFLVPLLTMRLFAEEKKQKTLDLLIHSDLGILQIILGKLMASFATSIFVLSFTVVFPLILAFSGYNDWGIVASSYLGIIFSILCYLSVGVFASVLTNNQIVSALVSFCILLGLMLLVLSVNATNNDMLGQIVQYSSIPFHYEGLVRGSIKSYNLVYFTSFVGFFIFLTHKSLGSRNW